MKSFILGLIVVYAAAQDTAPTTVTGALQEFPDCSNSGSLLATAMDKHGCPTSDVTEDTLNCLCTNVLDVASSIDDALLNNHDHCAYNIGYTIGLACANLKYDYPTQSDINSAVEVLSGIVGGDSGSTPATTTTQGAAMPLATANGILGAALAVAVLAI